MNSPEVIDSGANKHITCDKRLLKEICTSFHQPIFIPNGMNVPVEGSRKAQLPNGMNLNNALYIPNFKCNLISVSKLTRDYNCSITFTANRCVIQDLPSRTLIGRVGIVKNQIKIGSCIRIQNVTYRS